MRARMEQFDREPTREELGDLKGPVVVEFGATWCGYCQALAPILEQQLKAHPAARHLWIEDGPGRPLGRSFRVKLWPTLVFLRDGTVVSQVSRPSASQVETGLRSITQTDHDERTPEPSDS